MKRLGRATGSLAVITLLVASCGSSGGKSLSEDDFVDSLNSICKRSDRSINRLDPSDRGFYDDIAGVMQDGADKLADLKAPSDLTRDFKDFADNLDDQIKAVGDLRDAVDDKDERAIADAQDELSKLSDDADNIAEDIGVDDCVNIGFRGDTPTDDSTGGTTETTTANTPLPIDTTAPTPAPTPAPTAPTSPPTTQGTVPPSTQPEMSIPTGGDGQAQDASTTWAPPAGWTYQPNDPTTSYTPFTDPVLGPVLTGYWVGLIQNDTTGQKAFVYIGETAGEWTDEQVQAIYSFEAVSNGTDVTTPLGNPGRIAIAVGDSNQYDVGAVILLSNSLSIFTNTGGEDIVALLDAVYAANSMGG